MLLVSRHLDRRRALVPAHLFDEPEKRAHFGRRAVELDDEHGVCGRKSRLNRRFGRANSQTVHHLDGRGDDSGADNRRHRGPRRVDAVECR